MTSPIAGIDLGTTAQAEFTRLAHATSPLSRLAERMLHDIKRGSAR